jgi:hypothetical protein
MPANIFSVICTSDLSLFSMTAPSLVPLPSWIADILSWTSGVFGIVGLDLGDGVVGPGGCGFSSLLRVSVAT